MGGGRKHLLSHAKFVWENDPPSPEFMVKGGKWVKNNGTLTNKFFLSHGVPEPPSSSVVWFGFRCSHSAGSEPDLNVMFGSGSDVPILRGLSLIFKCFCVKSIGQKNWIIYSLSELQKGLDRKSKNQIKVQAMLRLRFIFIFLFFYLNI